MQINLSSPKQIPGLIAGFVQPWLFLAGVLLAAGIALEVLGGFRVPLVVTGQDGMLLAALLVYVGR